VVLIGNSMDKHRAASHGGWKQEKSCTTSYPVVSSQATSRGGFRLVGWEGVCTGAARAGLGSQTGRERAKMRTGKKPLPSASILSAAERRYSTFAERR